MGTEFHMVIKHIVEEDERNKLATLIGKPAKDLTEAEMNAKITQLVLASV